MQIVHQPPWSAFIATVQHALFHAGFQDILIEDLTSSLGMNRFDAFQLIAGGGFMTVGFDPWRAGTAQERKAHEEQDGRKDTFHACGVEMR